MLIRQEITEFCLHYEGFPSLPCRAPCSLYSVLLDNGLIADPYIGLNESDAAVLSEKGCVFSSVFAVDESILSKRKQLLCLEGLDTLCHIALNGTPIGYSRNMHTSLRLDVNGLLRAGNNELTLRFDSPVSYIRQKQKEHFVWNSVAAGATMDGVSHIRKALCMFGWDWGPKLPDMGVWRSVAMEAYDLGRITDIEIRQKHSQGSVALFVTPHAEIASDAELSCNMVLISPDGSESRYQTVPNERIVIPIPEAQLWWPNGLGAQPLYTVKVELCSGETVVDSTQRRIGLRTLRLRRDPDVYGEEFCFEINGQSMFAMGANYIPQDAVFTRITPKRYEKLLTDCARANFNCIRIWGGGYYPDEAFYDACDRLGLIVWQDFMFACMSVCLTPEFTDLVEREAQEVLRRIRHHASLGLLCGNNENEQALTEWSSYLKYGTDEDRRHYVRLFEEILPRICRQVAPDVSYVSSSPSSFGSFCQPNSEKYGDTHSWAPWHQGLSAEHYGNIRSRFCSEFGFSAFPSMETICRFAAPEERSLSSEVIGAHQKGKDANQKILSAMADRYGIPDRFDLLVYASQLLQADAIEFAVSNFRRNRAYCKGALYWQLNDCWPAISWSSIDYFGNWKALHWKAKTFFAPLYLSVSLENQLCFHVSNDTRQAFEGGIRYAIRENSFDEVWTGEIPVTVAPLTSADVVPPRELTKALLQLPEKRFLQYSLQRASGDPTIVSGTYLACKPIAYHFADPRWQIEILSEDDGYVVRLSAACFQRNVELAVEGMHAEFDWQYFDVADRETVEVKLYGVPKGTNAVELKKRLRIRSAYDLAMHKEDLAHC